MNETRELADLLIRERDTVLSRWRAQVKRLPSGKILDVPTLNDHIPDLIREIAAALQSMDDESIVDALLVKTPPEHGIQRLADGFDVTEVVAEYNILRGCIHDLAMQNRVDLVGMPFHIINRVLDEAIGLAVDAYAKHRAAEIQQRRDDYLAFVTHDLRTPLHAISLAGAVLEQMPAEKITSTEALHMIKSLRRNVVRLESLIEKVLEESTHVETEIGTKLERRLFDLWPLVHGLTRDLQLVAAADQARLRNEVPYDLAVFADAISLRRVFQNLIANAINHTPHGEVVIGALSTDHAVECWVRDTGVGMSEEILVRIFEKGFTEQGHKGRAGLGLAIVKSLIESHGGTITVESTKGAGSTFRFSLPHQVEALAKPNG